MPAVIAIKWPQSPNMAPQGEGEQKLEGEEV